MRGRRKFYIWRQNPTSETGGKSFQLQGRVKMAEKIWNIIFVFVLYRKWGSSYRKENFHRKQNELWGSMGALYMFAKQPKRGCSTHGLYRWLDARPPHDSSQDAQPWSSWVLHSRLKYFLLGLKTQPKHEHIHPQSCLLFCQKLLQFSPFPWFFFPAHSSPWHSEKSEKFDLCPTTTQGGLRLPLRLTLNYYP